MDWKWYVHIRHHKHSDTERTIEVSAKHAEGPEEALHCKERNIIEQVECPESTGGAVKISHEVHHDIKDQEPDSR